MPVRVPVAEDEPVMADTIAEGLRRRAMAVGDPPVIETVPGAGYRLKG